MNNVYILLELAKLDSEVYNLLMRASKQFNTFINSNIGLRATIRDSFLTRRVESNRCYRRCSFEFKGTIHRLDGPACTVVVFEAFNGCSAVSYFQTGTQQQPVLVPVKPGQTVRAWCIMNDLVRYEITDSQNEPSD